MSTAGARSSSSTRCTGSAAPNKTCCCRSSKKDSSCSSARLPRTRSSRSPARCSRAARCSVSNRSTTPTLEELAHRALADAERGPRRRADRDRRRRARTPRDTQRRRRAPPAHRARSRAHARRRGRPRRRSRSTTPKPRSRCAASRYGDDEHYDVVSAFIKSIRGSDPDAGLYWLARMIEAGEDARFIARRLVILASEDIGLADPQALLVADAAAQRSSSSGFPRRRSTSRTRCSTSRSRRSRTA